MQHLPSDQRALCKSPSQAVRERLGHSADSFNFFIVNFLAALGTPFRPSLATQEAMKLARKCCERSTVVRGNASPMVALRFILRNRMAPRSSVKPFQYHVTTAPPTA
jgi:hypothetical protein